MKGIKRLTWLVPLVIAVVLGALVMPGGVALAATSDTVDINATPSYISISIGNNTFDFGIVTASSTPNSGTGWFVVTNDSTVNINSTIQCTSTWEGGTNDWTYGAAGEDTAQLKASDGDGAYDITVQTGSAVWLNTTSTEGENWSFELQLEAPSSFTYGNEQTAEITISSSLES